MRKYIVWLRCHKEYIYGTLWGIFFAVPLIVLPLLYSPAKPSKKLTGVTVSKGVASANHRGDVVVLYVEFPDKARVRIKSAMDTSVAVNEEVCLLRNTSFFGRHTYLLLKKGSCG